MFRHLVLAVAIPSTLLAQDLRKDVEALRTAMVAAFAADPASIAKFYTDDAAAVGDGMRIVGRKEIDDYWKGIPRGATWKLEMLDVGGIPEAPWVYGRSTVTTASGDVSSTEYVGLLQRGIDGQLRFRTDAVAVGNGKASPGDAAAVRRLDSLWARMYAKNDTAAALQLYAEELTFRGTRGAIKTRAEELRDVRATPGLTMEFFRTSPTTVKTFDRIAVVSGTTEWRFSQNGKPSEYHFPYTAVYTRGGPLGWQITAFQMGDGRAASPSGDAQARRPVVAVFAHPDDERIIGPLLSRLAREGRETHLVIATDGAKGVRDFSSLPAGAELAAERAKEAGCAAKRLGVRLHMLGLPDAELASFDALGKMRSALTALFDSVKPAVIITFGPEGGTGHPDHRLVGNVTTQIVQAGGRFASVDLLYASVPAERLLTAPPAQPGLNGTAEALLTVRVPFEERDIAAAREEFACHRTQYTPAEMEAIIRYMTHAWNGMVWLRPWNGAVHDPFQRPRP